MSTLYCLHAIGPDDVHAAPSKEAAEAAARWYNTRFAGQLDLVTFEAAVWPHSPELHEAGLIKWYSEVRPFEVGDVVIHKTLKTRMTVEAIDSVRIQCVYFFGWTENRGDFSADQIEHVLPVQLEAVTSSNIKAVGYNRQQEQLHVQFSSGKTYVYMAVPLDTYADLREAESIGTFFARAVKPKFQFVELGGSIAETTSKRFEDSPLP